MEAQGIFFGGRANCIKRIRLKITVKAFQGSL